MAETVVSPIVNIISRLWTCCARHTRYLCELQQNKNLLSTAMDELKEVRDDVQRRVVEAEANLNEPKERTTEVNGWLRRVEKIEGEVEVILKKAGEQISRARCLGVCCPPNNCWSNYKVGKSIAKKIPLVKELKVNRKIEEVTHVARHTSYVCKLQDDKILLRNAMDELKNVRNDVQRKVVEAEADQGEPKMRTDQVRGWLQSVENIEGEVEVILQTTDEQLNNARCHEKDKLVVMKKAYVDELKEKGHFEELTYRLPPPPAQHMNLESTVGMESMFNKVWKHITSKDDNKGSIIGLYGHGGVGKTTLLKKINNEFNKICGEHGFDHIVMFVVVSKPINYEAIQKTIGKRLGLSDSFQGDGDESRRANQIFNQLRNKKNFVILLDDIWERVDLQRIGIPSPPPQNSSSKVIFTTRNKQVCGFMEATYKFQVECLPWDKAWSLFQDKVGEDALTSFQGARELAEIVARECGGLPLALITIGRAMSTTKSTEEWEHAITTLKNSASEFQGMSDEVLPRLKLSYDYLSNETIKSCFLYCALYPEDHEISMREIIDYWIAEGFLNGKLDEARSHGHHVIETLKRVRLLEESVKNEGRDVKMHDIIRDLALWIVNDCSSTTGKFLVASNSNVCERWRNAKRIFWWRNDDGDDGINIGSEEPPRSPNLQTLVAKYFRDELSLPRSFFQFTPILRVLDLSDTQLTEVPTSICQLSDLQYLSLRSTNIKELPVELRKLVKLKFLDLTYTRVLEKIPPGVIANLSELQVLKLYDSGFKDWGMKEEEDDGTGLSLGELDRLKQLQEVTLSISTSLALEELLCNQKLRRICTGLVLKRCVNLNKSISTSKGLGNLINIKDLVIGECGEFEELIVLFAPINDDGGTTNTSTTIPSAARLLISNNNKLEKLCLSNLYRLKNIVWEEKYYKIPAQQQHYLPYVSPPFQGLHFINILGCGALKDLTWLGYVQNLKHLIVACCNGLETLIELGDAGLEEGASRGGGDQMLNTAGGTRVFGRLKLLSMQHLPKLKSICRHALAFPSIERIHILKCPELKKLPLDSGSNVNNTLNNITGSTEWWDELQWEDETIKAKFLPYFRKRGWLSRC